MKLKRTTQMIEKVNRMVQQGLNYGQISERTGLSFQCILKCKQALSTKRSVPATCQRGHRLKMEKYGTQ